MSTSDLTSPVANIGGESALESPDRLDDDSEALDGCESDGVD